VAAWIAATLRHHPEMALFLTLALGYGIGRIRVAGLTLGAVVGVLIAGVAIGQVGVTALVTLLVGRYVVKMHPGILLGVCCGAGTSAPSLAAVQEVARSKIPTLGYGVTYAVGNVLLALWGSVIVALLR
jgi:putative transport protein